MACQIHNSDHHKLLGTLHLPANTIAATAAACPYSVYTVTGCGCREALQIRTPTFPWWEDGVQYLMTRGEQSGQSGLFRHNLPFKTRWKSQFSHSVIKTVLALGLYSCNMTVNVAHQIQAFAESQVLSFSMYFISETRKFHFFNVDEVVIVHFAVKSVNPRTTRPFL